MYTPSATADIHRLIQRLVPAGTVEAAAAQARLLLQGPRAVEPLIAALGREELRPTALELLGRIGDERAFRPALALLGDADDDVSRRALTLVASLPTARHAGAVMELARRTRSASPNAETSRLAHRAAQVLARLFDAGTEAALDGLVEIALDAGYARQARLAALDALGGLPPRDRRRLSKALRDDPDEQVRVRISRPPAMEHAASLRLDEPGPALENLPALHRQLRATVDRLATVGLNELPSLVAGRAAIHRRLAAAGSRIALYDLREALARLPESSADDSGSIDLLRAAALIGDAACLPPLVAIYAGHPRAAIRVEAAEALRAIIPRERLTRRRTAGRHLAATAPPPALDLLNTIWRSMPQTPPACRSAGTDRPVFRRPEAAPESSRRSRP